MRRSVEDDKSFMRDKIFSILHPSNFINNKYLIIVKTYKGINFKYWWMRKHWWRQQSNRVKLLIHCHWYVAYVLRNLRTFGHIEVLEGSAHSLKGKPFPRAVPLKPNPSVKPDQLRQPSQDKVLSLGPSQK